MRDGSEAVSVDKGLGYTQRYVWNKTTNRPNKVFVCSTCGAKRAKVSKILPHLNTHRKKESPKRVMKEGARTRGGKCAEDKSQQMGESPTKGRGKRSK